jgi:hypothetical protein
MEPHPPNTTASIDPTQHTGKSRKKLYIVLSICAILAVLGWLVVEVLGFKSEAEQAMTALNIYTDTLIQHDYESAYLITSPVFRASISYQAFVTKQTKLTERFGSLKSAKQTDWDLDSISDAKTAIVKANLQFDHGSFIYQFVLHKEVGIWRVFSYKEPDGTTLGKQ